jgi:hypothetical protein
VRADRPALIEVARDGIEPSTFRFSGGRSYRLSYLAVAETAIARSTGPPRPRAATRQSNRSPRADLVRLGNVGATEHTDVPGGTMATGETGFDDVSFDLISVQYHSLKAGHDYGQYVRDAENAGRNDIADFFRSVMDEDSSRAKRCHELLKELSGSDESGPALS